MIPPRVEVLKDAMGGALFCVERVVCFREGVQSVRIEKWNDERGFGTRWRLLVNAMTVIDARSPITFNGEDPFERFPHQVTSDYPGLVACLDLTHAVGLW